MERVDVTAGRCVTCRASTVRSRSDGGPWIIVHAPWCPERERTVLRQATVAVAQEGEGTMSVRGRSVELSDGSGFEVQWQDPISDEWRPWSFGPVPAELIPPVFPSSVDPVVDETPMVSVDQATSSLRVSVSRALALALITGIDDCEAEGRPLTQLQQIDLAKMTVMAFCEADEGEMTLKVWADLLRSRRPS